jgi:hypothetical protein
LKHLQLEAAGLLAGYFFLGKEGYDDLAPIRKRFFDNVDVLNPFKALIVQHDINGLLVSNLVTFVYDLLKTNFIWGMIDNIATRL